MELREKERKKERERELEIGNMFNDGEIIVGLFSLFNL